MLLVGSLRGWKEWHVVATDAVQHWTGDARDLDLVARLH
jgi:hypothetical protein